MKYIQIFVGLMAGFLLAKSDTNVQIIHNASFDGAATVDVYVNGVKTAASDDVNFQEATPYFSVTPNAPLQIKIAQPGSTGQYNGIIDSINTPVLMDDMDYAIMINGTLGNFSSMFASDIDLNIYTIAGSQDSTTSDSLGINLFHGVVDAPPLNVTATDTSGTVYEIASTLTYGNATGIKNLPIGVYEIKAFTTLAPTTALVTYNLKVDDDNTGTTEILFASGLVSPQNRALVSVPETYDLKLLSAQRDGNVYELALESLLEFANVQVVHNAPDPDISVVDIYVNDMLLDELDDVSFRTATEFLSLPASESHELKVTAFDADSSNDNTLYTITLPPLENNKYYVAMAHGVVDTGFKAGETGRDLSFEISLFDTMEMPDTNINTGMIVAHGATDLQDVDVFVAGDTIPLFDDIMYGMATSYAEVVSNNYGLVLAESDDDDNILGRFNANLTDLAGQSIFVFASGFDTYRDENDGTVGANRNFGLYVALNNGTVVELEEEFDQAYVQVVHNSPQPALSEVDVYINDELVPALDNIMYREATSFLPVEAGVINTVKITAPDATDANDNTLYMLDIPALATDSYHIAVANGTADTNFVAGAENRDISFELNLYSTQMIPSDSAKVGLVVAHGATDAPDVDVYAGSLQNRLIDDLNYGESSDYLEIDPMRYELILTPSDQADVIETYIARLEDLANQSIFVFASGLVSTNDEPLSGDTLNRDFGLFAVTSQGTVIRLITADEEPPAYVQVIHNSPDPRVETVDVYVNDVLLPALDNISFREATEYLPIEAFTQNVIKITDSDAGNSDDKQLYSITLPAMEDNTYHVAVAEGVVRTGFQNPDAARNIQFMVSLYPTMMEPMDDNNFGMIAAHGATDAPAVDIYTDLSGNPLIDNLAYGTATDFLEVDAQAYDLIVTPATSKTAVDTFPANLGLFDGQTGVIFASGFLTVEDERNGEVDESSTFGLFLALEDGTVIDLKNDDQADPVAFLQVIHNSADPLAETVDVYVNDLLLPALDNISFREATSFIEIPANTAHLIEVTAPDAPNSDSVNVLYTITTPELDENSYNVAMAHGVLGEDFEQYDSNRGIGFEIGLIPTMGMPMDDSNVGLVVHHGSTDAPPVDIYTDIESNPIISNLDYSEFTPYLELPAMDYDLYLTPAGQDETIIEAYVAPLSGFPNSSFTVFASGFVTIDDEGQNNVPTSSSFGLFAAASDGTVLELSIKPDEPIAFVQVIHNSPDEGIRNIDVYINDEKNMELDNFRFREATTFLPVPVADSEISVNLSSSNDVNELQLATFDLTGLQEGMYYTAMITGVTLTSNYNMGEGRDREVVLNIEPARNDADMNGEFDFNVYHGSIDLGMVDVEVFTDSDTTVVSDLDYQELTDYLSLDNSQNSYIAFNNLDIVNPMSGRIYGLPTDNPNYSSGTIVLSGLADITNQPNVTSEMIVKPYIVLPNGVMQELVQTNVSVRSIDEIANMFPNPAIETLNVSLSEMANGGSINIYDMSGSLVTTVNAQGGDVSIDLNNLSTGTYIIEYQEGDKSFTGTFLKK